LGKFLLRDQGEQLPARRAQHRHREAQRNVGTVVAVLVVDDIAARRVGQLMLAFPVPLSSVITDVSADGGPVTSR
jgi:hypothetical protein